MPEGIFLIQADKTLTELTEQPYDSEKALLAALDRELAEIRKGQAARPGRESPR